MTSIFLRFDIIFLLIRYAARIDSMTACFAFIDITFLWSYAVIFQLIHLLFQEYAQAESRKFRQFRILHDIHFYRNPSIHIDFPDNIDIHKSLHCDCKQCHLTVDFHSGIGHCILRGVGSRCCLMIPCFLPFHTDDPVVVCRCPPYIHFHWQVQQYFAIRLQLSKDSVKLIVGITETRTFHDQLLLRFFHFYGFGIFHATFNPVCNSPIASICICQ